MSNASNAFEQTLMVEPPETKAVSPINIKRILDRAIQYWYLIVISVLFAVAAAYIITRYTTRIYTVKASIIVREGNENAAAEFLYKSNPLVNPYRNFYNELYIMRSYPLLQQVVESLNFGVSWYREGTVVTTEVYGANFPIQAHVIAGESMPYGRSLYFVLKDLNTFTLSYVNSDDSPGKSFSGLVFGDTLAINGYRLKFDQVGPLSPDLIGKTYLMRFHDPYELAKIYSNRLSATWAAQGASIIDLAISGASPEKETAFLQKFIERYQQYDVDKKNVVATRSIEFLDRQLANIGDSLKFFDNQIENFKRNQVITNFDAEAQRIYQKIEQLESERAQFTLFSNYYKYLENYLQQSKEFDQIVPPSAVGISDQVLTGLITQLTDTQFTLRLLGDQQTESNPLVVERKKQIQQLKGDLMEGVKSIKAAQKINVDFISSQIQELEKSLTRLPQADRDLVNIRRSYSIRENLYMFLMQKRAEAGISRASTTSDIIVVNPPGRTGGPVSPKPVQNYLIAVLLGLLLPFLVFALLEVLNNRVQSREDIEQLTNLPILGGIGHNALHGNLAVFQKPKSAMAESFRALRSNLNYFTGGKDHKVFIITSSVAGEGKTFTTVNLATVMAFAGKKVLIIGADMRKPKIFEDFNLPNDKGLSTYLSGLSSLADSIQTTQIENLHLLSSGPVPPNPSELLMLPRTGEMITELLKHYDYILFDTPPLGLVSDAFALVPFAHHTIFMVRQNVTPRHFLRDLQELSGKRNMTHMSILFNDIKRKGHGYGYGQGYGYYAYNASNQGGYYE